MSSRSATFLQNRFLLSSIKQQVCQTETGSANLFFAPARRNVSIASNLAFVLPSSQCNSSSNFDSLQQNRTFHSSRATDLFKSSVLGNTTTEEQAAKNEEDKIITKEEYEKIASEVAELKSKSEDLLDKYRRSIAENDNMRKRLTKQIDDAKVFGIQSFCKDLLDVADVLAKAVEAGEASQGSGSVADMVEGLRLTQTQLLQVFGRHGLTQINPIKGEEKFDPNQHEALFQIPAPDLDPNIVLDIQKIGYSLHGRTIRPALVGVSKK